MPDTYTPNYNLTLVEIGASRNTWGQKENANFSALDGALKLVDDNAKSGIAGANANADGRVSKGGDTMTGALVTPKLHIDTNLSLTLYNNSPLLTFDAGGQNIWFDRPSKTFALAIDSVPRITVTPSGVTMLHPLTLQSAPTAASHAATKSYVDTAVGGANANANGRLSTSGGTVSGNVTVAGITYGDGFRFRSDGGTGLDLAGTNSIHLTCGGVATVRVDSAGIVHNQYGYLHDCFMRRDAAQPFVGRPLVQMADPRVGLYWPGLGVWNQWMSSDGYYNLVPSDNFNDWRFRFSIGGDFTAKGNVSALSDASVKTDITTITDALSTVKQLTGRTYQRTDLNDPDKRHIGLIAQEVQQIVPEVVTETGEGKLAVSYANLVPLLIEAIKDLSAEVEALRG